MAKPSKCPQCGRNDWDDRGSYYLCKNCNYVIRKKEEHAVPDDQTNDNEKKVKIPGWGKSLGLLAVGLIIFLVLFFLSPLPKAISLILNLWRTTLLASLPDNVASFIIDYFIYWLIGVIIALAVIFTLLTKPSFSVLFAYLGTNFIVIDIIFIFSLVLWYALINYAILDPYICTTQNTVFVSQISQDLAQRCVQYQQSQLPNYKKVGTTAPLVVSFGVDRNGQTFVPTIYQNQIYSLPVNLKNVDDKEDLIGIVVKGYVKNDTCIPGYDCLDMSPTDFCTQDNPCTIASGKSLSIVLRTVDIIHEKVNSYPDFVVEINYPKVAYGEAEFTVIRSWNDFNSANTPEPQSKTGPLDTVIYFSPSYYISTSGKCCNAKGVPCGSCSQSNCNPSNCNTNAVGTTGQIIMYVAVVNNGKGVGKIGNIQVSRIGDFSSLGKVQCTVPWDGKTFSEGDTYDLQSATIPKKGNIQFPCQLNMDDSIASALLNNYQDSSKGIPFAATANYNYYEMATYSAETPVLSSGIPGTSSASSSSSSSSTSSSTTTPS